MTSLVHADQVVVIGTQNSADNIRRLINIIWTIQNKCSAIVLSPAKAFSLYTVKVFDTVEW